MDKRFPKNKEINEFVEKVKILTGGKLTSGQTFQSKPIKDKNLIKAAIYGIDFNKRTPGTQNVDMFLQGKITIEKTGNYYTIKSDHTGKKGDSPKGEYSAVFFARYDSGRGNFGVNSSRFMVSTLSGMKSSRTVLI